MLEKFWALIEANVKMQFVIVTVIYVIDYML